MTEASITEGVKAPSNAPGTNNWADLSTSDVNGALAFYGELFGWAPGADLGADAGGYRMPTLNGAEIAGIGPLQQESMPSMWCPYIATDDIDALAGRVTANGGTILMPVMDVMSSGRMVVFSDPQGAVIGAWQKKDFAGFGAYGITGSATWIDLASTDMAASQAFYNAVFGWTGKPWSGSSESMGEYVEFISGSDRVGGVMGAPAGMPSMWAVYFSVTDLDASLAIVTGRGGELIMKQEAPGIGIFAYVKDPQGAVFALIQPLS